TTHPHSHPTLKTHYYKTTAPNPFNQLHQIFNHIQAIHILPPYEHRPQITLNLLKPTKPFLLITIITLPPLQTPIHFSPTTHSKLLPLHFPFTKQLLPTLYNTFHQKLIPLSS
ncbi:cytosolic protein, partial [Priestia megaterium]|uniref:cytosolic protein n=1 Tax=Priestia megaterium TaxID=1404 RepID=UPI0012B7CF73